MDHTENQDIDLEEKMKEAYKDYQNNIRAADALIYEITKGARSNVPVHELLMTALEAIDRMKGTDLRCRIEEILRKR